ncbi:MAG: HutD family protein [Candidatus Delongbacteria bacterium]|jgi:environmental stress-induced protein Ves|nr:HutD family protein [Candidatus Delongbacteria bacterium]
MLKYRIISPDQFKTVPWKNGLGTTKEIVVKYSPGIDNYLWRISIAGVVADGPFSDFNGYDRTLLMLEGYGIELKHSDGSINYLRKTSETAVFSGDLYTSAKLVNGQIKDFNVMTLRDKCYSSVEVLSGKNDVAKNYDELLIYCHDEDTDIEFNNKKLRLTKRSLMHIYENESKNIKLFSLNAIVVKITYIA